MPFGPTWAWYSFGCMAIGPARYSIAAGNTCLVTSRTLYLSDLLGPLDPVDVATGCDLVLGLGDEVQGVDHVVGVELLAVVEFHPLAQVELDRLVVDLAPGGGELALVLVGHRDRG
jgi:hypothetical protein